MSKTKILLYRILISRFTKRSPIYRIAAIWLKILSSYLSLISLHEPGALCEIGDYFWAWIFHADRRSVAKKLNRFESSWNRLDEIR